MSASRADESLLEPRANRAPLVVYPFVVAIAFCTSWVLGMDHPVGELMGVLWSVLIAVPVFVVVHELGHVLAGWLVGFRLVWFRATVLKGWQSGTGFRFGGVSKALLGGEVGMVPADLEMLRLSGDLSTLRRRLLVHLAGGPAASMAMAGLLAALVWGGWAERIVETAPPNLGVYVRMVIYGALGAALASVVLGMLRLVRSGQAHSDERQLRELLDSGPRGERQVRQQLAGSLLFAGRRPREWFPAWFRRAIIGSTGQSGEPMDDAAMLFFAYYSALDSDDADEAAAILQRYRSIVDTLPPGAHTREVQLGGLIEDAFLQGFRRGDAVAARALLEEVHARASECPPDAVEEAAMLRADAAVCLAEGDVAAALEKADLALKRLNQTPVVPALEEWVGWTVRRSSLATAAAERDWLEEIQRTARARAGRETAPQGG